MATNSRRVPWFATFAQLASRPWLWMAALRQLGRAVPRRWWGRPPFLPVPSRDYVRFRRETAYGSDGAVDPTELVEYLEWCRRADAMRRRAARSRR